LIAVQRGVVDAIALTDPARGRAPRQALTEGQQEEVIASNARPPVIPNGDQLNFPAPFAEMRGARSAPCVPAVVLVQHERFGDSECEKASIRAHLEAQKRLANVLHAELIADTDSGHDIFGEHPELVANETALDADPSASAMLGCRLRPSARPTPRHDQPPGTIERRHRGSSPHLHHPREQPADPQPTDRGQTRGPGGSASACAWLTGARSRQRVRRDAVHLGP
jgi:hypothetical protein